MKRIETEIIQGEIVPVLWRNTEISPTDPCPFCNEKHTHGIGDGHRNPHCIEEGKYERKYKTKPPKSIIVNGIVLFRDNGYTIKTRSS